MSESISRRSFFLFPLLARAAPAQENEPNKDAPNFGPFYPTPLTIVKRMLEIGELKPGERMFDCGSGDGRIVIEAAQNFGADATGVEIDKDLWKQSMEKIKALGLEKRARIILGDITKQDYSSADLITAYLLPGTHDILRPILEKQLKPGARVVAHDFFNFTGWTPEKEEHVEDDGEGRTHTIYLYRHRPPAQGETKEKPE